jgi:hypothetical protein
MKKIKSIVFLGLIGVVLSISSCKKDSVDKLGGEWDLPMTKVGEESSLYIKVGDYDFPTMYGVVTKNDNGLVRYKIKTKPDLTGHPDSALWVEIIDYLKNEASYIDVDDEGNIDIGLDFFITSEGYQVLSQNGKKQTIVRYNDPLGTEYSFDNIHSDQKIKGKVTEKTGEDDWPFLFFNIKTSKVEFKYPSDFPFIDKIIIRANHKFGLVYFETKFKGNQSISANLVNWGAVD